VTLPSALPSASQNNNSSAAPCQRGLPFHDDVSDGITNPSGSVALMQEELEAEENEDVCCFTCGKPPCEWLENGVVALDAIEKRFIVATAQSEGSVVEWGSNNKVQNKSIRFTFY